MRTVSFFFLLCLVGCNAQTDGNGFRVIDVPAKEPGTLGEPGYGRFRSQVIDTQEEFDRFVKQIEAQTGWRDQASFLKALRDANLDLTRESLVLIRHWEPSNATTATLATPRREGDKLVCEVHSHVPLSVMWIAVCHCFAVAVDKARVKQVEVWAVIFAQQWPQLNQGEVWVREESSDKPREVLLVNAK